MEFSLLLLELGGTGVRKQTPAPDHGVLSHAKQTPATVIGLSPPLELGGTGARRQTPAPPFGVGSYAKQTLALCMEFGLMRSKL